VRKTELKMSLRERLSSHDEIVRNGIFLVRQEAELKGATENAGLQNAGPSYRGGKRETSSYGTPKLQVK